MKVFQRITALIFIFTLMIGLCFSNVTHVQAAPNEGVSADDNPFSDEEKDELSLYDSQEAEKSEKNLKAKEADDAQIYSMYSMILMDQKQGKKKQAKSKKKSKGKENNDILSVTGRALGKAVGKGYSVKKNITEAGKGKFRNILGDGGTVIDVGYTEMYSLANETRGKTGDDKDATGTQLASFLATYNHYGYISTVSGQKAMVSGQEGLAKFMRTVFGGLVALSLALYQGINTLLDFTLDVLIGLNPLSLLGYSDGGKSMTDNPISNFVHQVFQQAGFTTSFFDKLADLSLVLVILFIVIGSMIFMTIGAKRRWLQLAKKGALLIFAYTAFLPLLGFVISGFADQVKDLRNESVLHENPASQHLFNARGWAASSNLSPTGLKSSAFPQAKADDGYIDNDFDPIRSRQMIADINDRTYSTLYGMDKEEAGFDLIDKWIKNENFNVNSYMSDIRRSSLPNKEESLPAYDNLDTAYSEYDLKKGQIKNVLWSANQTLDEDTIKVDHKNYKPSSNLGVRDESSFSTQSVVLMLQSSFDGSGARFYAYNLPPKGIQGELKNITTAKTEWKEVTMPGDGPLGVVGSWFSLAGSSLVYMIISIAIVIALISFTILENLFRIVKNFFKLYVLLNVYAMYSITFLVLASILTYVLALSAGDIAIIIVNGISSTIDKALGGAIPSGIISIVISLASLYTAYYISFKKPRYNAEPLIRTFVNLFMNMAFAYDDRVSRMTSMFDKGRNVENAKNKLFNKENKESANYQSERRTGYDNEGNEESEDGYPATYSSDTNSGAYVNRFARGRRQKKEMVDTRTYGKPGFGNHEMDKQESDEDGKENNNDNQSIEEQEGKTSNRYRTTNNDTSDKEISNKDNDNMTEEEKEELKKHGFIRNRTKKEVESQNENDTKTESETSTDSSEESNTVDTRNESRSESKNNDDKNSPTKEFAKAEVKGAAQDLAFDGAESVSGVDMSTAKSAKGAYDEVQTAKEMGYTNDGKPEKVDDVVENEVDSKTGFISGNKSRNSNNKSGNSESNEQEGNTQSNSHKSDETHSTEQANVYGNPRSRRNKKNNSSHSQSSQDNKQSPKTTSNKSKEASNKPKGYEKHRGKRTKSEERARKRFERKKRSKNTKKTTQQVEQKQETSTDYEYTRAAKRKPKK